MWQKSKYLPVKVRPIYDIVSLLVFGRLYTSMYVNSPAHRKRRHKFIICISMLFAMIVLLSILII